jgi:ribosomal protein L37E
MIPMGTKLRYCSVCGYPIHAKDDELTAHEVQCIEEMIMRAKAQSRVFYCEKTGGPSPNETMCDCQGCYANRRIRELEAVLEERDRGKEI